MSSAAIPSPVTSGRASTGNLGDRIFELACKGSGLLVLLLLGGIIVGLFIGGWPTFRQFGFSFITSADWDPVREQFGAAVPIFGTVCCAVLAILLAVPLAFGVAYWLTELAPNGLRRPVGVAVELLAAVPSIIYGMWGFFIIVPLMSGYVQPFIIDGTDALRSLVDDYMDYQTYGQALQWPVWLLYQPANALVDILETLFQGPPFGTGILTAALILAIMILPFIAATMRDVFETVPPVYKESAYGLGCTTWEVMTGVVLPYTRSSVVGGIMLGLGRALGETMAVTFVIGNANRITSSLFGPGNTIASLVALEFGESELGSLKLSALLALGFLLFVISFIVLATSRYLLRSKLKA